MAIKIETANKECLEICQMQADGFSLKEIAALRGYTPVAIELRIRKMRRRTFARSNIHLIAILIRTKKIK